MPLPEGLSCLLISVLSCLSLLSFVIVIVLSFSNCVGGHVFSFSVILEAGVTSDSVWNRALFPK